MIKYFKRQSKSTKIKYTYFLICLLIIVFIGIFQFTRALFINRTKEVVTNIKVGDLRYEFSSVDFNEDTTNIVLTANEEKTSTIKITNLNQIDTKYELYYEPNLEGLEIKYTKNSDEIAGRIPANETITIILNLNNTTSNEITITFKMNSGYGHNELALKNLIVDEYQSSTENIEVDIVDNMIPVAWNESTLIKADKTNQDNNWYDYDNQKWANAVLVTDASRNGIKSSAVGTTIDDANVLAYFTYIPRYKYLLWNTNNNVNCLNDNCNSQNITVEFENKTITKSTGSNNGEYLTHPAFTFGDSELNGIWIGKFTTSANPTSECYSNSFAFTCNNTDINPYIKPNLGMWRNIDISNMFLSAKKFVNYGLTSSNADSHMMKNMEWGAVAYLSQSKFGKKGNNDFSIYYREVYPNNYVSMQYNNERLTGCSGGYPRAGFIPYECDYPYPGQSSESFGASTTGNIYGIYDMAGGVYEYLMGQIVATAGTPIGTFNPDSSSGTWSVTPERKYYDSYAYNDDGWSHERGHLGDATKEVLTTFGSMSGAWYDDDSWFPDSSSIWFMRGGTFTSTGVTVGIFGFNPGAGYPMANHGFRSVLVFE